MPTTPVSFPSRRRSPMRLMAWTAVEPVPRPRTIPDFTYSTARWAAILLSSSWVRGGGGGEVAVVGGGGMLGRKRWGGATAMSGG
ncbi:hypothetical protein QJS10_CPA03g00479 [Acorus calamus]|uniref:Uncharacterized protein n=1 Tax=Acorus calamus TaxID=4465 RepID=A0AAV9F3Q3_ACOCL|nr:hypothetical protein QJS10_CPA03g00479 [Acorus calamus]